MGAIDLAAEAAARAADRAPQDASAWERLGRLRLRLMDRVGRDRGARAGPTDRAVGRGAARPRARLPPRRRRRRRGLGGRGGDRSSIPSRGRPGPQYAHALARTDRLSECIEACRRALALGEDPEVSELLARAGSAARASRGRRADRGVAPAAVAAPNTRRQLPLRDRALAPAHGAGLCGASSRPLQEGQPWIWSSTPSSSTTRHTSRRSSSTSIHAPRTPGRRRGRPA